MVTCNGIIIVKIINKNNLSLYCHLSTENAYATAELDNTVPIIVKNEIKIEFFVKRRSGIFSKTEI